MLLHSVGLYLLADEVPILKVDSLSFKGSLKPRGNVLNHMFIVVAGLLVMPVIFWELWI